jgi:hypothetical protein
MPTSDTASFPSGMRWRYLSRFIVIRFASDAKSRSLRSRDEALTEQRENIHLFHAFAQAVLPSPSATFRFLANRLLVCGARLLFSRRSPPVNNPLTSCFRIETEAFQILGPDLFLSRARAREGSRHRRGVARLSRA